VAEIRASLTSFRPPYMTPARLLRPSTSCLPSAGRLRVFHRSFSENASSNPDHRASSKLFEDAAREEASDNATPGRPSRITLLEQEENWTGDESVRDAVLRMLVDKYKPLRGGPIRTAEEKLKATPPTVRAPDHAVQGGHMAMEEAKVAMEETQTTPTRAANEPLLPGIEGHQPWHTTFKVPSHATASVRYGRVAMPSTRSPIVSPDLDEKARRQARETKRRTEQAGRLSRARESTLDYRLGIKSGNNAATEFRRPNPVSMKGWANLVEDRIERARQEGFFRNVKGRGQPLTSNTQERNPFIGREEFLMNRIVQRQGAAPPWVEVQGELESAVAAFRGVVKQSWARRAIRMLTASQPLALLPQLTLDDVTSMRDTEWEEREKSYHDRAIDEINALVRKYNGLAPYAVRRPYYMLGPELERVYRDAGEDILRGLAERMQDAPARGRGGLRSHDEGRTSTAPAVDSLARLRLRDLLRDWLGALRWR